MGYPGWPKQTAYGHYNRHPMTATGGISNTVVQSEATLRVSDAGACASVQMRMHSAYDQSTSKYAFECKTEDEELPARVGPEGEPETRDYEYTQDGPALQVAIPGLVLSAPIGKPESYLFRVIERKIVACCPHSAEFVKLNIFTKELYNGDWISLEFDWPLSTTQTQVPEFGK